MKYKRKINTILLLLILILFITIISFSFAAFTTRIVNSETSSTLITGSGVMQITFEGGEHLNAPDIIPSNDPFVTKTFTLTGVNSTEEIMNYHLILNMETNTFRDSALAYTLSSNNVNNNGKTVPSKTDITGIKTSTREIFLGNGYFEGTNIEDKVHSYTLKLYFPLIENFDHTIDQNKEFSAKIEIKEGEVYPGYNHDKGVNHPVLFTGMTPIKWDGINEVETTEDDPDWYDYEEKIWANAKSLDGSYWVWIPRYAYKIETCYHTSGEDCYNLTGKEAGDIDVKFLKSTTNIAEDNTVIESTGYEAHVKDTSTHHFLHPAFQFNGEELGFWMAKFEPSVSDQASECYNNPSSANCNNSDLVPKIIPGASTWRHINIANSYHVSKDMKNHTSIYGWLPEELDSHMITPYEWGAVTYLTTSQYGADGEVWNNAYNQYITGCSGENVDSRNLNYCVQYSTANGQKASTTHNIYGVYDMAGGAWERTMGNYNNLVASAGFETTDTLELIEQKYILRYSTLPQHLLNGYGMNYDITIYGDFIYEMSYNAARYDGSTWTGLSNSSWYFGHTHLPSTASSWIAMGGDWGDFISGENSGIFAFDRSSGMPMRYGTFRFTIYPL